ncbi:tetratricopeptide repeat protein [Actinomadura parmotrematis]|uniref:Tetratricopeptide repeat protein n=1 Tax=Actinomadura parmotrematis TaxID=2864039 RepID=A0ABS7FNT9_9ACTN|nr:tetratricopeptide repeat protein [Actinomadura parmotrematis]MBW8482054.1 tetratricopeptide repeat protein [Actinomadura parmotrematis]
MEQEERGASHRYTAELAAFARDLGALRIEQGKPSLQEIERSAPPGRPLSKSGVSETLGGKRLPGLDFLIALVRALLQLGDPERRPVSRTDPRLDEWRSRWRSLQMLQADERRSQAPEAPVAAAAPEEPSAEDRRTVRIFVAMPGTSMGDGAAWPDVPSIRRRLLAPVAARLEELLGRPAELVLEKEKTVPGLVHRSMFPEALNADVYIADLTGANPNVYLELGVRWAMRDGVTVLICQDLDDVRYNAVINRVIEYGPMPDMLDEAIQRIAAAAAAGLREPSRVDSPVRDGAQLVLVPRRAYDALAAEVGELRQRQADDLLKAARRSADLDARIGLLREAVKRNPAGWRGFQELGSALRRQGRLEEAETALRRAAELDDGQAPVWRELGLVLGRIGRAYGEAIESFDRALALDGEDAETWSIQGGMLRRQARQETAGLNAALLERARESYRQAARLEPNTLYPLMNAARIDLLLAGLRGTDTSAAADAFRDLEHLARYTVSAEPSGNPWSRFDLADALLLSGRTEEGLAEIRRAATACPPQERAQILATVAAPMRDYLILTEHLPPAIATSVHEAVHLLEELAAIHET